MTDPGRGQWSEELGLSRERYRALAEQYLSASGLTAEDAMDALSWQAGDEETYIVPSLPAKLREEDRQVQKRLRAREGLFDPHYTPDELADMPDVMTRFPTLAKLTREEIRDIGEFTAEMARERALLVLPPKEVEELERRAALLDRDDRQEIGERFLENQWVPHMNDIVRSVEMSREQHLLAVDKWAKPLADLLTTADGTRRAGPREWFEAHEIVTSKQLYRAYIEFSQIAREQAEQRATEAEARAETAERQLARRPSLRQGTAYLSAVLKTESHIRDARRTNTGRLSVEEQEARKLFRYEPLGYAERLAILGLAAIARDQGLLRAHPGALASHYIASQPAPKIRMKFPGLSELARTVGYEPGPDGKISKATRALLERALVSLTTKPRWIAEPVLVPVKTKKGTRLVPDTRVSQVLWVEASVTVLTKHIDLDLHPVAVASMLASFISVDNLAARYEEAKKALGQRQMRDEWALCDDYLRHRASVKAGAERALAPAEGRMVLAGEQFLTAEASVETFRTVLGLNAVAKERGETAAKQRELDAIQFAKHMGTLIDAQLIKGKDGPKWEFTLPHPDGIITDPTQGLLLSPTADNSNR